MVQSAMVLALGSSVSIAKEVAASIVENDGEHEPHSTLYMQINDFLFCFNSWSNKCQI